MDIPATSTTVNIQGMDPHYPAHKPQTKQVGQVFGLSVQSLDQQSDVNTLHRSPGSTQNPGMAFNWMQYRPSQAPADMLRLPEYGQHVNRMAAFKIYNPYLPESHVMTPFRNPVPPQAMPQAMLYIGGGEGQYQGSIGRISEARVETLRKSRYGIQKNSTSINRARSQVTNKSCSKAKPNVRTRTVFTLAQKNLLEDLYKIHPYISPEQCQKTTQLLDLSATQVRCWFQNRRAKTKRAREEMQLNSTIFRDMPRIPSDQLMVQHSPPWLAANNNTSGPLQPLMSFPRCTGNNCPVNVSRERLPEAGN